VGSSLTDGHEAILNVTTRRADAPRRGTPPSAGPLRRAQPEETRMTARPRPSRVRRLLVVATLAGAMLAPTAALAAPGDSPGQAKKSGTETTVTTTGLSWLGLSWL
jgi:hypothetical protein